MMPPRQLTCVPQSEPRILAAEFFAGIGLARRGLESAGIEVVWANDYKPDKQAMYERQFGIEGSHFLLGDIFGIQGDELPREISIAWASSPCTDLSLAGDRAGLDGEESGTFFEFTRIMREMGSDRPPVVVLENVVGLATSHEGDDLAAAVAELNGLGYSVDVLTLDARRFLPQSRERLFLVATTDPPNDEPVPNSELRPDYLQAVYGNPLLKTHRAALPPPPPPLTSGLGRLVERMSSGDPRWWEGSRQEAFLQSLSPNQARRLSQMMARKSFSYRTAYRRTRNGKPVWEIRPDDISGCLRTARGGSSKQAVVKAGRGTVQVRWMTSLEYARLMGAGDFDLKGLRDSQALFGFGDAVCVPAVSWLANNYLVPLLSGALQGQRQPLLRPLTA